MLNVENLPLPRSASTSAAAARRALPAPHKAIPRPLLALLELPALHERSGGQQTTRRDTLQPVAPARASRRRANGRGGRTAAGKAAEKEETAAGHFAAVGVSTTRRRGRQPTRQRRKREQRSPPLTWGRSRTAGTPPAPMGGKGGRGAGGL